MTGLVERTLKPKSPLTWVLAGGGEPTRERVGPALRLLVMRMKMELESAAPVPEAAAEAKES
jgi:hypothetical protein